jgi:hypothetical protein
VNLPAATEVSLAYVESFNARLRFWDDVKPPKHGRPIEFAAEKSEQAAI